MVVPQLLSLCVHHWEGKMFQWAQLKIQTRYPDTSEPSVTLNMENRHWLRTGYRCLNQRLTLSVLILSIDTDHILHCGLQAFNCHFCLIHKGSEKANAPSTSFHYWQTSKDFQNSVINVQWPGIFMCGIIMKISEDSHMDFLDKHVHCYYKLPYWSEVHQRINSKIEYDGANNEWCCSWKKWKLTGL